MRRGHSVLRRFGSVIVSLTLVVAVLEAVQFAQSPHAARARADAATGTAGQFIPLQERIMDTRDGTGGYFTQMVANTPRTLAVAGVAGIPASGVSAVAVNVTAVSPSGGGAVQLAKTGSSSFVTALLYDGAESGTISNSAIVAVGSDGRIQVMAQSAVHVLIDVQGYYTAGDGTAAPGGYVPVTPARLVDTRTGTGLPLARLSNGATPAITVGGRLGVPANASAIFLQLTPISYGTSAGFLTAYPTGTSFHSGWRTGACGRAWATTAVGVVAGGAAFDVAASHHRLAAHPSDACAASRKRRPDALELCAFLRSSPARSRY